MKITKVNLPNLKYKVLRKQPATSITKTPLPNYDIVKWTKASNNMFGPNYVIKEDGEVLSVLPDNYASNLSGGETMLVASVADTKEAKEAFDKLKEYLFPQTKEIIEKPHRDVSTDDTERSEVYKGKKAKRNK